MDDEVKITSREYWFKVVEMLQQNWALIEFLSDNEWIIYFFGDTSGVFDELNFKSKEEAITSLLRNGFKKHADDEEAQKFLFCPEPPFRRRSHPNGAIYSSGRHWK